MNKKNKFFVITILSTITIFLLNKIIFILSTIKNKLYSYNGNYFQWRFGKVFYTKQGKGDPILLVHNLTSSSSDIEWSNLIKELQKGYTVYTIDLLGCGRSDKPKLTYTSYLYVQLITDFTKNIIEKQTNVIASGLSSSFINMACYQNPQHFNKLLFINPESIKYLSKCPKKRNHFNKLLIECPLIGTLLYNLIHSKKCIKKYLSKNYYKPRNLKNKFIDGYHEACHLQGENSKYLFASTKNLYTNINIIHALKQINNSIYIVLGEKTDISIKDEYVTINPSIETAIINNTKKLPQLEKPEKVLEICSIYFN